MRGHALSLSAHHAPVMDEIRLDTFRALLEHGYSSCNPRLPQYVPTSFPV